MIYVINFFDVSKRNQFKIMPLKFSPYNKVSIKHDGSGPGDQWHLDRIELTLADIHTGNGLTFTSK